MPKKIIKILKKFLNFQSAHYLNKICRSQKTKSNLPKITICQVQYVKLMIFSNILK